MVDADRHNAVHGAKRSLHREELTRFAGELEWLQDPSGVTEDALGEFGSSTDVSERCFGLARWMIGEFAYWSGSGHSRLSWRDTFERYDLSNPDRILIRETFQKNPGIAYVPGLLAMSEVFAAVPAVANRDGVGAADWTAIAAKARTFGGQIARDDTDVQYLVRNYLHAPQSSSPAQINLLTFDVAKLRLDPETGISSVTPISDLLGESRSLLGEVFNTQIQVDACVALQAKSPCPHAPNVFDANWLAFAEIAARIIYPQIELPAHIPAQAGLDPNYRATLKAGMTEILEGDDTYADLD